jgi:hypothetical protein
MAKMSLEQRRALILLARVEATGITEALMLANGFKIEMLNGLVRDGLATAHPETVRGQRPIEVTRMRITEAGRQALAE